MTTAITNASMAAAFFASMSSNVSFEDIVTSPKVTVSPSLLVDFLSSETVRLLRFNSKLPLV